MKLVVWMNQPSHYQATFFRELAARPGLELVVFYATGLAPFRRALGWQNPGAESYPERVLQGSRDALAMAWRHRQAVHLVNGIWSVRPFVAASLVLLLLGRPVYFHAEHPDPAQTRGGTWHVLKRLWTRAVFVRARGLFAIGRRAGEFYRKLGVPASKIIPFMYFQAAGGGPRPGPRDPAFRILFVGQFVPWKRVEDLIAAFDRLRKDARACRLEIVGAGPLRERYVEEIARLGLDGCAAVRGPLSPAEVQSALRASDVLVLPSSFDGWGLTVNEALQAGLPAICSDGCGAAELLWDHPGWGLVFPRGDVAALARALDEIRREPDRYSPSPAAVDSMIGPREMTDYFLQKIASPPAA